MSQESTGTIERWTTNRRAALVVRILKGDISVAEAAWRHGLSVAEIEDWQERFPLAAENALRGQPKDDEALKDDQIKNLTQKIGDLVFEDDILREALKSYGSYTVVNYTQVIQGYSERYV